MKKLQANQILVKNAKLVVKKLDSQDPDLKRVINDTKEKQEEILKLKQLDRDSLGLVVQL